MIRSILVVSPEAPYPLHGGGAFRTASLLHYFARFAEVDLVLFSESGRPALVPPGLLRSQTVIPLSVHGHGAAARYLRNARRALRCVPPLIDRLSGHGPELAKAVSGKHYDLGLVEHFWCAPYVEQIAALCERTVLDLHNIESVLHARCAETSSGLIARGHARFAKCSRQLEASLLPRYSLTLTTSDEDAATARGIAPGARVAVYPNAIPDVPAPAATVSEETKAPVVVFSGNFEYHPNIDAVRFLVSSIWPEVRQRCPELRLRLVGRGDRFILPLLPAGLGIETTGTVEDAQSEISDARIVIAPLRSGSGTRIKILQAWAAGRPVVATSIAAEGLDYQKDRNLLIADEGIDIATAIASLNSDPQLRARLGADGRRVFEKCYTWQAAWKSLDGILGNPDLFRSTSTSHRYTEDADANRR